MRRHRIIATLIAALVFAVALVMASGGALAASTNAGYDSHIGSLYPTGGTIAETVATPDDGKFLQMGPDSTLVMKFPGLYAAIPDGTSAADLRVDIYDSAYPAFADVYTSLDGVSWTFVGQFADTVDIDVDVSGPVKYVKLYQPEKCGLDFCIDQAFPQMGFDLDAVVALNSGLLPYGTITAPAEDSINYGWLTLGASYWDDDHDDVSWAVRYGTCAAATGTVFGNVDGRSDPFTWDGATFAATADTSSWTPGWYCFVFNPQEDAGEQDVRLTRGFFISDAKVSGGGQILHGAPGAKMNDMFKISFGGEAWRVGTGLNADALGTWTTVFHNVSNNAIDKMTFEATSLGMMNFFGDGSVANFEAVGTLDGAPGYVLIVRVEDVGEPSGMDSIRVELWAGLTLVYDSLTDFPANSSNFGTARTWLDHGNLQVEALP